jgi:hypothetical protein
MRSSGPALPLSRLPFVSTDAVLVEEKTPLLQWLSRQNASDDADIAIQDEQPVREADREGQEA